MRRLGLMLLLGGAVSAPLAAQDPEPLQGRVPAELARQVEALAESVSHQGLPGQPLVQKALEGGTKGVPADRILAAVRMVAGQLDQSARALRVAGVVTDSETIEAGAYAINAGLHSEEVTQVARASRAPQQPAGSLRSAGTLVAMGVPSAQAVSLVRRWIETGHSAHDVAELPAQVQAAMAPGVSPAQAAAGVGKGHANPKAGGPPPHPNGPPGNRPPPGKPDLPKKPKT